MRCARARAPNAATARSTRRGCSAPASPYLETRWTPESSARRSGARRPADPDLASAQSRPQTPAYLVEPLALGRVGRGDGRMRGRDVGEHGADQRRHLHQAVANRREERPLRVPRRRPARARRRATRPELPVRQYGALRRSRLGIARTKSFSGGLRPVAGAGMTTANVPESSPRRRLPMGSISKRRTAARGQDCAHSGSAGLDWATQSLRAARARERRAGRKSRQLGVSPTATLP